ncbi:MAG TPA: ABC transporter ATP-binding protein [Gemmataceae bacterium]|jgi:predicted ABC-type transport system involved in lysophospholipase L1 biosynthesis ATPase subunit
MSLVTLDRVDKTYGTAAAPVHALRDVTLAIGRGERVALLGKSGSGKSTLLQLLGGLDRPTAGRIAVAGHDLAALSANRLAAYRQSTVGMIFQAFHLIASRTALENVELPLVFAGRPPRDRRAAARAALEAVGLGHRLTHRPAELSGGERQRVAIARALVNRPALLLADEPTGNLDTATAAEVMGVVLDQARAAGMALVLVTHDEELAGRSADRIVRLADGVLENGRGE